MLIRPILAPTAAILSTALSVTAALSQGIGAGIFDLSEYSEQARFGSWRVSCTAEGNFSRTGQTRDCLLEEDSGFVIFAYPSGYYVLGLRDAAPGDTVYNRNLATEPRNVILTYFGPGFTEEYLDDMGVSRAGVPIVPDAEGFADAEAEALRLSGG